MSQALGVSLFDTYKRDTVFTLHLVPQETQEESDINNSIIQVALVTSATVDPKQMLPTRLLNVKRCLQPLEEKLKSFHKDSFQQGFLQKFVIRGIDSAIMGKFQESNALTPMFGFVSTSYTSLIQCKCWKLTHRCAKYCISSNFRSTKISDAVQDCKFTNTNSYFNCIFHAQINC